MRVSDRLFAIIFLSIPVTWAGSFIAGVYVAGEIDPLASTFWRFLLSALVMLPLLAGVHRAAHPDLRAPGFIRHLAIVVVFAGLAYHLLFFWALAYVSPTNAALIIALSPFFTGLAEVPLLGIRRPARFYVGFLMALAGALWVILVRGDGLSWPGFGDLLCLLAGLSWSLYTLAAKATRDDRWDSLWINGYSFGFTALLLAPIVLPLQGAGLWRDLSATGWLGCWYMAIFPTAIGYTLFYIGVQRRGPAWASAFGYLVPSITAGLDCFFFGAAFSVPMIGGTTLVVLGLATSSLHSKRGSSGQE